MRRSPLLWVERGLLAAGVTLLVFVMAALVHRAVFSRLALVEFDHEQAALIQNDSRPGLEARVDEVVDFGLWSEQRVRGYKASLLVEKNRPLAVLVLARLRIRVPVFEGTDDLVLNRGVGWVAGTARPGQAGDSNIGIAGHRDGFFRAFNEIAVGDTVQLTTPGVVSVYTVDGIEIVHPDDVGVLRPRGVPSLTLITCYPFYFVGDAPQRFIVHATLKRQVGLKELKESGSASILTEKVTTKETGR